MNIDKNNLSGEYHADVGSLLAEIERLERKNANQAKSIREYQDLTMGGEVSLGMLKADHRVTAGELAQLKAENEALRKDAERYRAIRDDIPHDDLCMAILEAQSASEYDAAVDAAMNKEEK